MIIRELNVEPCKASSAGGSVRGVGGEGRVCHRARLNERSRPHDWRAWRFRPFVRENEETELCFPEQGEKLSNGFFFYSAPPHVKFINFPSLSAHVAAEAKSTTIDIRRARRRAAEPSVYGSRTWQQLAEILSIASEAERHRRSR